MQRLDSVSVERYIGKSIRLDASAAVVSPVRESVLLAVSSLEREITFRRAKITYYLILIFR